MVLPSPDPLPAAAWWPGAHTCSSPLPPSSTSSLPHFLPCPQAILSKQRAETLSSVLYPDDRTYEGKELRLKQQHFFVSATVQARTRGGRGAATGRGDGRG